MHRSAFSYCIPLACAFLTACTPVYWLGVRLYYDKVEIPAERVVLNIGYDPGAVDDHKRQLDLYLPEARGFATVVFIHGGGWAWGDRSQRFGGADVYGNIGRFLATQGYAAAIPSYRLIWKTDWRTQVSDVARAVAWMQTSSAARGGDPRRIFLMGHSAGAQLGMRVAIDPQWLRSAGGFPEQICGVVAVSGAGYDMEDRLTELLDRDNRYYVQRFGGSVIEDLNKPETMAWRKEASVLQWFDPTDPPFLSVMATQDIASVQRQTRLADERMGTVGVRKRLVVVSGDHERLVLELSRGDHPTGRAILEFLRDTPCPRH